MNDFPPTHDKNLSNKVAFDDLKQTLLFHDIDDDAIADLVKIATSKHYKKGTLLFSQHDEARYFYIIKSGWTKLFRQTLDGSEAIVDILTIHHVFGITALYQDSIYDFGAQTISDSVIIKIPLSLFSQKANDNNEVSLNALKFTSHILKKRNLDLEHRDLQTAPQRIGCFLLKLCDDTETNQPITLHLPYSKTLVASRLGMQAETFSRALNKLKESLDMTISGSSITINDIHSLEQYSCRACSLCKH